MEKVVSLSQSIFDYSFYLEFVEKSKQQVVEESVSTSFQSFSLLLNLPAPVVLTLTRVRNGQLRKVAVKLNFDGSFMPNVLWRFRGCA